jgi:CheY-like chemotaxis protein/anti-sigma regulatory factor (Ser/Thr protein kinase)
LSDLVAIHFAEAALKGLRLRLHDCGAVVAKTDRQLLTRIVSNIIDNAIRYTNQGGVLVACRHRAGTQWIEVWDTGVGIPADKTQFVFEEFRQLENTASDTGSGLGLAIVAKAAALLGLQIRLRSQPGRGSMFAIELPLGRAVMALESALPPGAARRARIGLVDDSTQVLEALVQALEHAGHEVIAATSAKELLERLHQEAPDIVISDYRLRLGETGFDVIEAARAAYGDALRALIITGDTDPEMFRSMSKRGIAIQYKPLSMAALQAFVSHAIECKSS